MREYLRDYCFVHPSSVFFTIVAPERLDSGPIIPPEMLGISSEEKKEEKRKYDNGPNMLIRHCRTNKLEIRSLLLHRLKEVYTVEM